MLPYARDAWFDETSIKIGYEISFNRYFYKPQPLRSLEEIRADILAAREGDRRAARRDRRRRRAMIVWPQALSGLQELRQTVAGGGTGALGRPRARLESVLRANPAKSGRSPVMKPLLGSSLRRKGRGSQGLTIRRRTRLAFRPDDIL